ncbi:hypothetical protein LUZ60_009757 [Juncus effusus]|nr:hypothetical protein LUZ60_009757 [Juncus effusus]
MAATMVKEGPRYAPPDPSLPKPWRALIDGATGNVYFWNPLTKVTQYDRPSTADPPLKEDERGAQESAAPARNGKEGPNNSNVGVQNLTPTLTPTQSHQRNESSSPAVATAAVGVNNNGVAVPANQMSPDAYRRLHEITVVGKEVPVPYMTFESTPFPPGLIRELYKAGFKAPTAIQAQSWPIAMQRKDIIAVAKTGSGKTLGFLLPGFIHLKRLQNDPKTGPTVLVLSPTRELATQIQDESVKFGAPAKITTTCLYGGAPKGPQIRDVERGVDVVVATPGRLNDILEMRKISLQQVTYLVLDEADRMLDMGFEPQIRKIAAHLPARRQTLMYTATWPVEVRKIAHDLLNNPVQVNIGNTDQLAANKSITQHVEVISSMEKRKRLEQILRSQEPNSKIIIFCSTKKMCDMLARHLERDYGAAAIHGDKSQSERDSVLADFRNGRYPVLVATDVAARGLDVKDIKAVINYDFPSGVEDYVHRIGRTGRAGATGTAFTFFSDQDGKYAGELVKVLEGANQKVPAELKDMVGRGGYGRPRARYGDGGGSGFGGGGFKSSGGGFGSNGGGGSSWGGGSNAGGGGSSWGGGSNGGGGSTWGRSNGGGGGGGTNNNNNDSKSSWGGSSWGGSGGGTSTWSSSGGGSSWGGSGSGTGGGNGSSWGGAGSGGGGGSGWGGGSSNDKGSNTGGDGGWGGSN